MDQGKQVGKVAVNNGSLYWLCDVGTSNQGNAYHESDIGLGAIIYASQEGKGFIPQKLTILS